MKIYSWNVNGIRSVLNKGALQGFFAKFEPDILCIQETKAQPEQVDLPENLTEEYNVFWNSAEKKGYSGTAIFIKKSIAPPAKILRNFPEQIAKKFNFIDSFGDPNKEGRILAAEFENFILVTCYTPNSKRELSRIPLRKNEWDPAFRELLAELRKQKPVIFCGDMNVAHEEIDLADPKRNHKTHGFTDEEREGFSQILSAGFIDSFREKNPDAEGAYTWWSNFANSRANNRGWRIDYFGVDNHLKSSLVSAEIYAEVLGSDHCPILVEINGLK